MPNVIRHMVIHYCGHSKCTWPGCSLWMKSFIGAFLCYGQDLGDGMEDVQEVDTKLMEISPVNDAHTGRRLYLIVDTNVLLSDLSLLEEIRRQQDQDNMTTVAIVPWIVLNELDYLKKSNVQQTTSRGKIVSVAVLARKATNTLLEAIKREDPFFRGETLMEYKNAKQMTKDLELTTNDDKILQSCMYFGRLFLESSPGGTIALLSNDKNLLLKAKTNGIHALSAQDLEPTKEAAASAILQADNLADKLKTVLCLPGSSTHYASSVPLETVSGPPEVPIHQATLPVPVATAPVTPPIPVPHIAPTTVQQDVPTAMVIDSEETPDTGASVGNGVAALQTATNTYTVESREVPPQAQGSFSNQERGPGMNGYRGRGHAYGPGSGSSSRGSSAERPMSGNYRGRSPYRGQSSYEVPSWFERRELE